MLLILWSSHIVHNTVLVLKLYVTANTSLRSSFKTVSPVQ